MYSRASCHSCGDPFSHHDGCPGRVVICKECRKVPKKLAAAREAMELHLLTHVEVKLASKSKRSRVPTGPQSPGASIGRARQLRSAGSRTRQP